MTATELQKKTRTSSGYNIKDVKLHLIPHISEIYEENLLIYWAG